MIMLAIFVRDDLFPGDVDDFHLWFLYRRQSDLSPAQRAAGAASGMSCETS
jgi:hypothetical protein